MRPAGVIRGLSTSLSGYLCGTHSGVLGRRRGDRLQPAALAEAHARLRSAGGAGTGAAGERALLGERAWQPTAEAAGLADELRHHLDAPGIIDLLVFGSQARRTTTGYSDLDAILVLDDAVAEDPRRLRRLRRHVLAAQRATVTHQPMQHHGFEVVTPTLLDQAWLSLAMPPIAVRGAVGLFSRPIEARFRVQDHDSRAALETLVAGVTAIRRWPSHPWRLHLLVSQFELLPVFYLQCDNPETAKAESFAAARDRFPEADWPFDALARVREAWPRRRYPTLTGALTAMRNPWAAIALWRHTPQRPPPVAHTLLRPPLLASLQQLAAMMLAELRAWPPR